VHCELITQTEYRPKWTESHQRRHMQLCCLWWDYRVSQILSTYLYCCMMPGWSKTLT